MHALELISGVIFLTALALLNALVLVWVLGQVLHFLRHRLRGLEPALWMRHHLAPLASPPKPQTSRLR